jgi:hypothetical protein
VCSQISEFPFLFGLVGVFDWDEILLAALDSKHLNLWPLGSDFGCQ